MADCHQRSSVRKCARANAIKHVFLNDLFYHIKDVYIHAYADDEQLFDSDTNPKAIEQRILHQVQSANQWYTDNGIIVNPDKH